MTVIVRSGRSLGTMPTVTDLATRFWDLALGARPTYATLIGEHAHDSRIESYDQATIDDHLASLLGLRREIEAAGSSGDDVTRALLAAVVEADITEYETEILIGPVDAYLGPHCDALRAAAMNVALGPDHAGDLADRYAQIGRMLDQAATRQLRLARAGRPPAAVSVGRVVDQVDAYLASPLSDDPFVNPSLPDDWTGADRWRASMEELVTGSIRPAYVEYRRRVVDEILPLARPDDLVGICHLSDGETSYRRLTERFVTVPYDPDEIHRIGLLHVTEILAAEMAEVGSDAFGMTVLDDLITRVRTDPTVRYVSEDEMLAHARDIVERAWAAIDGWLGARPDGPCQVLPVPATLAKDMPPAYYMPPAQDGSRPGTYFLNTHEPGSRHRYAAEATAFHEAIPGHHFDRALASALTDLPDFRRFRIHNVHAEGWGLYSERLADEMGLYSRPADRFGMLAADAWRAGRLVVDTGMHHHGWSRAEAVAFLEKWTPLDPATISQEIDRYIGWPGQALSYKMGQIEIMRLRADAEQTLGSRFDIVGFHDTVLTSGGVTIRVLEQLVDDWVRGRRPR